MNRYCIQNQLYGWPFYMARKLMRSAGQWLLDAADALSQRERFTPAGHLLPVLPENRDLHNRHRGRRCFIIGTGPSLARQDLTPLAQEITVTVNGLVRHPLVEHIAPTYYCFADSVFFDGSPGSCAFLDEVRRKVRHSTFITPLSEAERIQRGALLPIERTRFFATAGKLKNARLRRIDLTRPLPAVINCAQLAIMVAIELGCSPIYLLGLDHDWLAHRAHEGHFYAGKTIANHAHAHGDKWKVPYHQQMRTTMEAWMGYENLLAYAQRGGIQIINCTAGGFLDVFPRQSYEQVVGLPTSLAA